MRLADSFGVPRQHFIDEYFGNELDQTWLDRMATCGNKKWVLWIATFRTQAMSRRYLRWLWVS
jgi:RNA polymerase primary sigma factor